MKWLRLFLAVLLLGACLILIFRLAPGLMSREMTAGDDFVEYWAAGRLNLQGGDPYSPEQLAPLQLGAGRRYGVPVPMWNPPWTLPLVMPFGALPYPVSRLIWLISQTALVLFCASATWRFFRGPATHLWVAWLIAITFLPTLYLLKIGQISAVMLTGVVLFIKFTQRRSWWLAGLSILLILIKPQTLYLVGLAYLFWAISQRRWWLLAGSGIGICLATCISLWFNPAVFKQYLFAINHQPPMQIITPTLGGTLRYFLGGDKVWLQFVPTAWGLVWFCFHWRKARHTWSWPEQLPLLLMVSVLTTSYGWTFDYVVLLPAVLAVAAGLFRPPTNFWHNLLATALYLAIEAGALATNFISPDYFAYAWFVPALVGWYLLMVRWGVVGSPSEPATGSR